MLDLNGREVNLGDIVRIPEETYPWVNEDSPYAYAVRCRHATVTRQWDDGVVTIVFSNMIELNNAQRAPFQYDAHVMTDEVAVVRRAGQPHNISYQGGTDSEADATLGVREQPRDERGRFTSSNTTQRPTVTDRSLESWMVSMTQTHVST